MVAQRVVNVGNVNPNWKRWVGVWLVVVVVATILTEFGFLTTLTGTAGLFFVVHGLLAARRSVSPQSVEETPLGSIAGKREAVQVVGRAESVGDPLQPPLTETDCVAYQVEVKEFSPSSQGGE